MNVKELLKQHILTILCVVALLALFLPFCSATAEMEILGQSQTSSSTTSGFQAIKGVFWGWGLVIGPVLLVAMNYVKQLEKYKGLLAIAVPAVCIVIEFITFFIGKSSGMDASAGGGMFSAETSVSFGIGFFLLLAVYAGMIVAGAVFYHNFTLDKAGLERLKTEGAGMLSEGFSKVKDGSANVIHAAGEKISAMQSGAASSSSDQADPAKPVKKTVNRNKAEEILCLIEKLAAMKENGILTEEEFAAKKKELLEEI